jgi:two-component system alkaline phosphatase synthesis response regulator PhoP
MKKILIIDDEPLIITSTKYALEYFGYTAVASLNGDEGLRKAPVEQPDLILLDVMMPGMDGWEVLARLKGSDNTRNIPVIMFTAKEYYNGRQLANEKGAADFLAKPFDPENLHRLIKANLEKE